MLIEVTACWLDALSTRAFAVLFSPSSNKATLVELRGFEPDSPESRDTGLRTEVSLGKRARAVYLAFGYRLHLSVP